MQNILYWGAGPDHDHADAASGLVHRKQDNGGFQGKATFARAAMHAAQA